MADILTTAKELIFYYEFFKNHDKFDYKGFIYDVNELFQDFLNYFPPFLLKLRHINIENNEKSTKNNEGVVLSLLSSKYRKKPASSYARRNKIRSTESLNYSSSSLFNTFLKSEIFKEKSPIIRKNETKSTIIHLKSRKITLNEAEINKICNGYKRSEKNKHFRILPENFTSNEEFSLERSSLHFDKLENNENFLDNELFEGIFKSKTVFHKQMSSHISEIPKEVVFPKLNSNKNAVDEERKKDVLTQIMPPMKAENFKYLKQIPDIKSYKNLQNISKDYLSRFIIKR